MLPKAEIAASTVPQEALEIENRGNGADRYAETNTQESRLRALVTDEQLSGPRIDGQRLTPAGELERLELRAEALAERISAKRDDVERSVEIVGTITDELELRGVDPVEAVASVEEALRASLVANAGEDYEQPLSPREEYGRLVALEESDSIIQCRALTYLTHPRS